MSEGVRHKDIPSDISEGVRHKDIPSDIALRDTLTYIPTGGINHLVGDIAANDYIECFKRVVDVCEEFNMNAEESDISFGARCKDTEYYHHYVVIDIIENACKCGSLNIIKYAFTRGILNVDVLKSKNWKLVRNSTGKVLQFFLQLIELILDGSPKPNLNVCNHMFLKLCEKLDTVSIDILIRYGYLNIDAKIYRKIKCEKRYLERMIDEMDGYGYGSIEDSFRDIDIKDVICPYTYSSNEIDLFISWLKKFK